jgi:hypothetical protein
MASAMAATCDGAIDLVKPGSGAVEVSGGRPIVGYREIRGVEVVYCNRWFTGEIPSQCRPSTGIDEPLAGGERNRDVDVGPVLVQVDGSSTADSG